MDRATLHKLVETLPESEVHAAGKFLEYLHVNPEAPELSERELEAVDAALASLNRGEWVSHEEVGQRLRQWTQG